MRKIIIGSIAALTLTACTTDPYTGQQKVSRTAIGAGAGAAVGALGGLIVGKTTNASTRKSVLIGAGIGALTGGGVGLYQDRQEAKLREELANTGVSVTRQGDVIILNMPSNITFATDQADIRSEFFRTLNSVALVLKEFDQSLVNVYGHTDSDGSDSYNQQLSERRAVNVAQYLVQQGTDSRRYQVIGYGEAQPIASNATEEGKARNRRVEIQIAPLTQS
ncbi:OmpA family protein [Pseudahrensia aquimaris]|uniref:OmpA family protein n=1 Tax=Pseudahrensia aquimaris TaxID=744461 RepID=A0ABW3FL47_9HYPH